MGSLRAVQYHDVLHNPHLNPQQGAKLKPLQLLIGTLKADVDPNRSPLGSPPVEKKRLRRLSNNLQASTKADSMAPNNLQDIEEKENTYDNHQALLGKTLPILKKTTPKPTMVFTKEGPTRCSHDRRVRFNSSVQARVIGAKETKLEPLNVTSDRDAFITRNVLARSRSQDVCDALLGGGKMFTPVATPANAPKSSTLSSEAATQHSCTNLPKNVSISFTQDSVRGGLTAMKFVLFMGPNFDPDNIVVKANMSGNRLRVVAQKVVGTAPNGDIVTEQYNERYQLPMQVDPYKVEARLDGRGYLTVDAPLLTVDQRRSMEQSSGSISV